MIKGQTFREKNFFVSTNICLYFVLYIYNYISMGGDLVAPTTGGVGMQRFITPIYIIVCKEVSFTD